MIAANEIYNMDCMEGMKKIEDHSIDMILCDPPYGRTKCEWDTPLNLKDLWEEYLRIAKETAAIVIFGKQPFTSEVIMSNKEMFRYELIWISIHALRVEGDETDRQLRGRIMISIHALRVEGDWERLRRPTAAANFYPRPPGGGRQQKRTKFSSVFAQKGEEFASLRRGKREFAGGVLKRTNFGF